MRWIGLAPLELERINGHPLSKTNAVFHPGERFAEALLNKNGLWKSFRVSYIVSSAIAVMRCSI